MALLTRSRLASAACGLLLCSVTAMQETGKEGSFFGEEGVKKAEEETATGEVEQEVCKGLDSASSTSSNKVVQVVRSQDYADATMQAQNESLDLPPPPPPNYHGFTNFGIPDSDAWFNTWFTDPKVWADIGKRFRKGEMIKVTQAMRPEVAEALWQDLVHHKNWVSEARNHDNMQFKRHNMNCSHQHEDCPKVLSAFHAYLQRSIDRWSQLPLAQLHMWPAFPMATWYRPGDHIAAHDDMTTSVEQGTRALAFILSMTKNWPPKFGGQLGWFSKSTGTYTQHAPEFNSLYIFEPSAISIHTVSPVVDEAPDPIKDPTSDYTVRRLTISGWFTSHDRYYMARINEKYNMMPNYISEQMPPEYKQEAERGAVSILAQEGIFPLQPEGLDGAGAGHGFVSTPDPHSENPKKVSEIMPEL
eukprot:CAMPEP_0206559656 /NCGR_PEP_ID=MMETSP0325_2-20121206/20528_1 /ASSEMBLY_ACC=CAM_ASM_000347 /TAXON_ID=2866 /ORGANISM="Crypthecodinium cohnii, Strain Seligo" /LENGTH=415 /DNA_ID=CAMNT_0054061207 /DNA_START=39 /DNA_END=1286 /DNA_ORIENTATION=+